MLVQHSKAAAFVLLIYLSAAVVMLAAGRQRLAAGALDLLLIVVGAVFIAKPHLGNFSRSLGLVLLGLGGFDISHGIFPGESRFELLFFSILLAGAFMLYGIECLRKRRLSFRLLGGTFVIIGLATHAVAVWLFCPLAGTSPLA